MQNEPRLELIRKYDPNAFGLVSEEWQTLVLEKTELSLLKVSNDEDKQ